MSKRKHALLVIDMQLVAFDGKITPPVNCGSQLLRTVSDLIDGCRAASVPVIYAQTCAPSGRPYAKDVHGWEIHPEVERLTNEAVIYKVGPSAFENPDFEELLSELDVTTLIVCGIWSEGCVSITVRGALKRDFEVWLAGDGHGTVREESIEVEKIITEQNSLLADRGAEVMSKTQILARIKLRDD